MSDNNVTYNNQMEKDHTEVSFQTVDDILEYYGKRHKEASDSKESVN
ncbi:hypothetical protein PVOR_22904 [Paenibacillus vortex V453]|uniref:Uncharacterized protein n=1 Tax=Paenibacillus vortex V453 TaxID=715225 RepID=A0A2R9SS44_9BACL|nr:MULTISPECIES: hypothetical protein [Paenibacillus]EFU40152.1 hypothetical protein PVOR_22904 [Paenibacillus vortex V453]MDH6669545.1 hypothetical protein [Paenibacillus sp. LBL]